eukprot:GHVS01065684.1.p1 GENE.GHVS01065684.1~~GHVS01065684.1.p1  ORF type:complete len:482 (-),score=66.59 GHVS01065684.1:63-1508(-)
MFVYLSLNKQSKMAAWASSRRVALWMTVSLLCVVYTLAAEDGGGGSNKHQKQKTPLLVLVFQRVHGKISVDGFVAALLYMKYINSKSKHQVKLIPHEGTAESVREIETLLEVEKTHGRDVTVVYLGVSPDGWYKDVDEKQNGRQNGLTEDKMLEKQLKAEGGGGLRRVKVFDNHATQFCKEEDKVRKAELGFDCKLDFSSTSQKVVEMIKEQGEAISDEYGRLVEFAEFIEMEGSEEDEAARTALYDRYLNVVENVEREDLTDFVATRFDDSFQLEFSRLLAVTKEEFSGERPGFIARVRRWYRDWSYKMFWVPYIRDVGEIENFVKKFYKSINIKDARKGQMFTEERVNWFYQRFPRKGKLAFGKGIVKFRLPAEGKRRLVGVFFNGGIVENYMTEKVRFRKWMENADANFFVSKRSRRRENDRVVYSVRHSEDSEKMVEKLRGWNAPRSDVCRHPCFTEIMMDENALRAFENFVVENRM